MGAEERRNQDVEEWLRQKDLNQEQSEEHKKEAKEHHDLMKKLKLEIDLLKKQKDRHMQEVAISEKRAKNVENDSEEQSRLWEEARAQWSKEKSEWEIQKKGFEEEK